MAVTVLATPTQTSARLAEYPRRELDLFLRATGSPPQTTQQAAAAAVAELLHQREPVLKLVTAMRTDVRDLFFVVAVGQERIDRTELVSRALTFCGLARHQAEAAIEELAHLGLVVANGFSYEARRMPDLVIACADAAAGWLAGVRPDQPEALDFRFLMALAASVVAEDPPRLTQQGRPHVRWQDKFAARVAHPAVKPLWANFALVCAQRAGIVRSEDDADGSRTRPWIAGAHAAFALAPADLLSAICAHSGDGTLAAYAATMFARASESTKETSVAFSALCNAADELQHIDYQKRAGLVPWESSGVMAVAEALGVGDRMGLLSCDRGPTVTRVRKPVDTSREGRWTVLPNFRVLVPEDTPPEAVFRLGMIARLERVDRVTEFVLDRASVARRTSLMGLDQDAVTILAERNTHALPDSVREQVIEWDSTVTPLRSYLGAFIVAVDAHQAAAIRADPESGPEISSGIFFVAEGRLRTILARARKSGIPVALSERAGFSGAGGLAGTSTRPPDLAGEATRFGKRVATAATAKVAPQPKFGAAAKSSFVVRDEIPDPEYQGMEFEMAADEDAPLAEDAAPVSGVDAPPAAAASTAPVGDPEIQSSTDALARLLGVGEDELRNGYRFVYAAVRDDPDLLRLAARLPVDVLRRYSRMRNGVEICDAVRIASVEWEKSLRRVARSADIAGSKLPTDNVAAAAMAPPAADPAPASATPKQRRVSAKAAAKTAAAAEAANAAAAKAAAGKTKQAGPPPDVIPPTGVWSTLALGDLRDVLAKAVAKESDVYAIAVLYTGGDGATRERVILPRKLRTSDDTDWLDANEPSAAHALVTFRLDRIGAVRV